MSTLLTRDRSLHTALTTPGVCLQLLSGKWVACILWAWSLLATAAHLSREPCRGCANASSCSTSGAAARVGCCRKSSVAKSFEVGCTRT